MCLYAWVHALALVWARSLHMLTCVCMRALRPKAWLAAHVQHRIVCILCSAWGEAFEAMSIILHKRLPDSITNREYCLEVWVCLCECVSVCVCVCACIFLWIVSSCASVSATFMWMLCVFLTHFCRLHVSGCMCRYICACVRAYVCVCVCLQCLYLCMCSCAC